MATLPRQAGTTPGRNAVVWAFTAALAVTTLVCWLVAVRHLGPVSAPVHLPWPLFAAGFTLGHFAGINVSFRKSRHRLDLTDVVLLPAIVFAGSGWVIAAAITGTVIRSAYLRRPLLKTAANVSIHALSVALAIVAYHDLLGGSSVLSTRGWLAAIVAVVAAQLAAVAAIHVVIGLSAGRFSTAGLAQVGTSLAYTVAIDTTVGLVAVHLLWASLGGGILYVLVAVAVAVAFSAHGRLRMRHATLNQLYHFEQALAGLVEADQVISSVLKEALLLFNSEVAQLYVAGPEGTETHVLRAGDLRPALTSGPHPLVELLGDGTGLLLAPRTTRDPRQVGGLAACGLRDAIALRLPSDLADTLEVLVVGDHLGPNQATFDAAGARLAEALATPAAMALRSSDLLKQLRTEVAIKEHQASHDSLTGLANRSLFASTVDEALAARLPNTLVGILLMDLDGFKALNDTLGHEAGDSFLQHLAACMCAVIGERGTVARLGGDEFAVLVPGASELTEIASVAKAMDLAVRAPVTVAGITVDIRASIGVAASPVHGEDRTTLLRHADFAMYRAKQRGGGVAIHNDYQGGQIDRPSLIAALREAIQTSSLNLHYQPKVLLGTEHVVGVEALLRWTHPLYGTISPDQVIPAAESSGLIVPLTRWVLTTALAQCSAWHREGIDLNVAVNLSPAQIDDPDIVVQVRSLLETHNLPPEALTIEITESAGVADQANDNLEVLEELAALGVRLSIDDFGVGTSSLARIRRFPVSEVKIDKSFVTHINDDPKDYVVVSSTVALAHQLGLDVVAEGVETQATSEQLRALGCDVAQGYLISAPLHPDDLLHWIRTRVQEAPSTGSVVIPFARRPHLSAVGQLRSS